MQIEANKINSIDSRVRFTFLILEFLVFGFQVLLSALVVSGQDLDLAKLSQIMLHLEGF